eukprot:CAMPEP_0180089776 /NCGR_PEP_ID=MMETSP0985-20121206/23025_1 /TAXON_ID=483367 /ORGANISM="non described non described, Strain CCMP 2436" /LENGTH=38 /DNA_ID= /DNA_START= /DNA_END= /DNA_ORIENTATION=
MQQVDVEGAEQCRERRLGARHEPRALVRARARVQGLPR